MTQKGEKENSDRLMGVVAQGEGGGDKQSKKGSPGGGVH